MTEVREQLQRMYEGARAYFMATDDSESMHIMEVLGDLLTMIDEGTLESQAQWYLDEAARYE